jgi:hypothetical protein
MMGWGRGCQGGDDYVMILANETTKKKRTSYMKKRDLKKCLSS